MLKSDFEQVQKLRQVAATWDRLKSELEQVQKMQQETSKMMQRKVKMPSEPLVTQSRSESKMEVDKTPRPTCRLNFDRVALEQISKVLKTWTPP